MPGHIYKLARNMARRTHNILRVFGSTLLYQIWLHSIKNTQIFYLAPLHSTPALDLARPAAGSPAPASRQGRAGPRWASGDMAGGGEQRGAGARRRQPSSLAAGLARGAAVGTRWGGPRAVRRRETAAA